jgi:glutathione S-transferase
VARAYVKRQLADPAFRRWRAMGAADPLAANPYAKNLPLGPWPGPEPVPAEAVAEGKPENTACPYSGKPVTHLLKTRGRTFGFCNAFCRDKTVADPEAWPAFMALLTR